MEGVFLSKELLEIMFLLANGKEQLIDLLIGSKEISLAAMESCDYVKDKAIRKELENIFFEVENIIEYIDEQFQTESVSNHSFRGTAKTVRHKNINTTMIYSNNTNELSENSNEKFSLNKYL